MWVPWEELSSAAAVRLVEAITDWVAHRMRARVENAGEKKDRWWVRPSMVIIYGPNGQPLLAVEQQEGDAEPRQVEVPTTDSAGPEITGTSASPTASSQRKSASGRSRILTRILGIASFFPT